jgi:hypothetical protein
MMSNNPFGLGIRNMHLGKAGALVVATVGCLWLGGCSKATFDAGTVRNAGGQTVELQSEQVSIQDSALNCAIEKGLFEVPYDAGSRMIARLTEKGRNLGFSDDVSIGEQGYSQPYTQVRGTFKIEFGQVVKISDVQDGIKPVQAVAGVKIPHECFPSGLTVMGINGGTIAENIAPAFEFDRYDNDWHVMSILH